MNQEKRTPLLRLAERILLIAAAVVLSAWGIGALYRTADRRHSSYSSLHIASAINRYNTNHPEICVRSLEDAAALYDTLGGREALGLSYSRFAESLSNVTLKIKGQNMVVAYAPDFIGRPPESTG